MCDLINEKLEEAKEKDADELYDYIVNNKNDNSKISKNQIKNAFESCNIDLDEKEIQDCVALIKKIEVANTEFYKNQKNKSKIASNANNVETKSMNSDKASVTKVIPSINVNIN